jgi:hypothetical protein
VHCPIYCNGNFTEAQCPKIRDAPAPVHHLKRQASFPQGKIRTAAETTVKKRKIKSGKALKAGTGPGTVKKARKMGGGQALSHLAISI